MGRDNRQACNYRRLCRRVSRAVASPVNATKVLAGEFMAASLLVTIDYITAGQAPKPRAYLGLAGAFVILALLAEAQPAIAKAFGALVLAAILFGRGRAVERLGNALGR